MFGMQLGDQSSGHNGKLDIVRLQTHMGLVNLNGVQPFGWMFPDACSCKPGLAELKSRDRIDLSTSPMLCLTSWYTDIDNVILWSLNTQGLRVPELGKKEVRIEVYEENDPWL